ncbi:MAG: hypothetical protein HQQ74_03815 [Methanoculleus bourgensis]|uniref:Uncharacterized protein n=1 Tax=Methanoculleus bourgensis TaxID=83986 RepID=A0A8T7H0B3_9EURY|nr:hypothetical protein [Methanoculleus bourgensis]
MEEITQEVLDHIPDPVANPARETQIVNGKVGLITPHNEETECKNQRE